MNIVTPPSSPGKMDATGRSTLFHTEDKFGAIEVIQHGDFRILTFGSAYEQSNMNIHKPNLLVHEYMQAMMLVLGFLKPTHVTLLGLGAGCLLRSLHEILPNCSIEVIELRQKVFEVARDYFSIPNSSRITPHIMDAYQWIKSTEDQSTQIIFADLYHAEGMHPLQMQKRFLHHCQRILTKKGWLVVNYHKMPEKDSTFYEQLNSLFKDIFVCPISSGNNILFASTYPVKVLAPFDKKILALEKQLNGPLMQFFKTFKRITEI